MRTLPAGPDAVLLDFAAEDDPAAAVAAAVAALADARARGSLHDIDDLTPGATTLLVQGTGNRAVDMLGVHRALRAASASAADASTDPQPIEIPVAYDGVDLDEVASMLGVDVGAVTRIHRDTLWRVEFMGFAPGFGYLVPHRDADGQRFHSATSSDSRSAEGDPSGGDPSGGNPSGGNSSGGNSSGAHPFEAIGRRAESRHRVPAGSVAIAAGYSAVYPRESPGGWYLLGHTDIELWNTHATPPALLSPGALVRFVDGASS